MVDGIFCVKTVDTLFWNSKELKAKAIFSKKKFQKRRIYSKNKAKTNLKSRQKKSAI